MPFLGELAAVGTSLCYSFGSVLFTSAGRILGAALVNRVRLLLALLLIMAWHLLAYGQILPLDAAPDRWFWLGASGVIGFVLGDFFLFQAFVMIGPRLAMLMLALAPVLGVVLAWIFLGEILTPLELLGIGLALAGIIVVISERRRGEAAEPAARSQYMTGLLYGLGAAGGQAVGLIFSKQGLYGDFPALSANAIRLLAASVVIWAIAAAARQIPDSIARVRANPRAFLIMFGGAVLGPVFGVSLTLLSMQHTSVGVASTLSSLMPIFLIPISYFAFGERITRQAVFGTLIAFVGMVTLFL